MIEAPRKPGKLEALYTWALLPAYIWQGLSVRAKIRRLQPPQSNGLIEHDGKGELLRLLIIGDSSAAGVGVDHIGKSFAGFLPALVNLRSGRPVAARVAGMNSATSADIRDYVVPHIEPRDFDYIALNIGVNDAKNFHSSRRFREHFGTLLYALRARFPHAAIIWSGVLDLAHVPALPAPLNRILGIRSRIIDSVGRMLCHERGAYAPDPEWQIIRENFADDGFHASEAGYREWAAGVADFILALESRRQPLDKSLPSMVG
jgi:lysophospholipase L1-like esterase